MSKLANNPVKRATVSDAKAIASLEEKTFSNPYSEEAVAEMLASSIHPSFLLEDHDGALLGYLLGQMISPEGDLLRIAVNLNARRCGVGRALIEAFLSHLRSNGCTVCFLDVREHNAPAQALYTSFGFTPFDRRKNYYHLPTEDAIVMRLSLDESK